MAALGTHASDLRPQLARRLATALPWQVLATLALSCGGAPAPRTVSRSSSLEGVNRAPLEAERKEAGPTPEPPRLADALDPPALLPLPDSTQELSLIAFGSCQDARAPIAALRAITELPRASAAKAARSEGPDLMVYLGDNVYGDEPKSNSLKRLLGEYRKLGSHPDFLWLTASVPLLAIWDDHDFGRNDGGGDFSAKADAEALFERFFGTPSGLADHAGVYSAHRFGPKGRVVQLILLDTRFDRSPLARGQAGEGRYVPHPDPGARMLSEEQWSWLAKELEKPAEVRLLLSSIQVLPDQHGGEAWNKLPLEQARLLSLMETSKTDLILVSGDRHFGAIYADSLSNGQQLYELTTSSLNRQRIAGGGKKDSRQLSDTVTENNFGTIAFDWEQERLQLGLHGVSGELLTSASLQISKREAQGTD